MSKIDIVQQIDVIWNMSEDDLYKHLGMASLGTESMSEAVSSMQFLMSTAENTDSAVSKRNLADTLLERGKKTFDVLWNGLKNIVCSIYRGGQPVGDAKDLSAYIIGILIETGKIANPFVALVITIAVKKGLDLLCPVQ